MTNVDKRSTACNNLFLHTRASKKYYSSLITSEIEIMVVYHLHKDSSISEWKINGTHIFGRPNRKITGINGLLEKVVLFDRLERFKRFISFPFTLFLGCSTSSKQIYKFVFIASGASGLTVNGKRILRTRFSN